MRTDADFAPQFTLPRLRSLLIALLAVLTAVGLGAVTAPKAEARTDVSIGIGVGAAPYYYRHRPYWNRPYWGPRPDWYGARWYRPYSYWGPGFNFYASFPMYQAWPDRVRTYHRDAFSAALAGPIGETYGWDDGYDNGAVTAVRDGHSGDKYCREFRQEVSIAGRLENAYGAACRDHDGSWHIVPNNP